MIARLWRGRTRAAGARAYEDLLRAEVLPELERISGYEGAYVLRRDDGDGVEFLALTLWRSLDAVRDFAGDDHERAVITPEARDLLSEHDERVAHYEVAEAVRSPA